MTVHYLTRLDAAALGRRLTPAGWQDARAERRAARRATVVLGYSERVAAACAARGAHPVPMAIPLPTDLLAPSDQPIAANVADWRWPPNRAALDHLLRTWPEVRAAVPGARLLLAGRGLEAVGTIAGVDVIGPVERSRDVLAGAAVLAFPCPPTSGPKTKVLEAMAHGLPVVTTPAGVEGVFGSGTLAEVAPLENFARALASLLREPERRAALRATAHQAILEHHAPRPAARARVAAIRGSEP
jgi:glycosyltransferase involved in cell wall biosynthesis